MGILKKPHIATFIFITIYSLAVFLIGSPAARFYPGSYFYSMLTGFGLWLFFAGIRRLLPRLLAYPLAVLVGFILALIIFGSALGMMFLNQVVTKDMIGYISGQPDLLFIYMESYLTGWIGVGFVVVVFLLSIVWFPRKKEWERFSGFKTRAIRGSAGVLSGVLISLISINQIRNFDAIRWMNIDAAAMLGVKVLIQQSDRPVLHSSFDRYKPAEKKIDEPQNVVIFIIESWGKQYLPFYGNDYPYMPFLQDWIERERNNFIIFDRAYTNSTRTDVSLPSLMTGVGTYENNEKLHKMPMIWDWAEAAGLHTIFVSSQKFTWQNFLQFCTPPGPETFITSRDMKSPLVNDLGVDDLIAIEFFNNAIDGTPDGKNFMAIYNSSGLHGPYFQRTSERWPDMPAVERGFGAALMITDRMFKIVYDHLSDSGRLDNTVIIFTADHGEVDERKNVLPRAYSYYDEFQNIPLLIWAPEKFHAARPEMFEMMAANTDTIVSNVDLVPTLAQLLDLDGIEENRKLLDQLIGAGLFGDIDDDRFAISINTNDVIESSPKGFGIFFREDRFVFSTVEGPGYFNSTSDPLEKNNLWSQINETNKARVKNIIKERKHLREMFKE